jgi:DNA-binding response OmpR family regulator
MLAHEVDLHAVEGTTGPPARRILIVDDDPQQTEVLSYRLGRLGYRTLTAHRGDDGLRMAKVARPHLVLLDLRLPDADGLDICQQLTDGDATCGIPVIILSGMERPDIIRRSRGAGCHYFIRKPYDPNALLVLVEHAMRP